MIMTWVTAKRVDHDLHIMINGPGRTDLAGRTWPDGPGRSTHLVDGGDVAGRHPAEAHSGPVPRGGSISQTSGPVRQPGAALTTSIALTRSHRDAALLPSAENPSPWVSRLCRVRRLW